jgi:hypothetical protein
MNVVATDTGTLVEVQGTGEGATFPRSTLDKLLDAALGACDTLFALSARRSTRRTRVCCPTVRRRRKPSAADPRDRVLVASRNAKKLAELRRVLDAARVSGSRAGVAGRCAGVSGGARDGATFEENALAKARDGFAATGLACVADDSGLSVDALNGMPGCCRRGGRVRGR